MSNKLCFIFVRTAFIFNDNKLSNFDFSNIFSCLIVNLYVSFDKHVSVNLVGVFHKWVRTMNLSMSLKPFNFLRHSFRIKISSQTNHI